MLVDFAMLLFTVFIQKPDKAFSQIDRNNLNQHEVTK
jgi:hypothetical protein